MAEGEQPEAKGEKPEAKGSSGGTSLIQNIRGSLTKAVADRAQKTIEKLVGAYWPEILAKAQDAQDQRDARSTVRKALAEAMGRTAAEKPELVHRMLDRFIAEEFGFQENREAVAVKAIEHLQGENAEQPDETAKPVEEDWLNLYNSFAEKASSESLRDMWARVLAGEIRKPGSFSLSTLQFISVMDKETAEAIKEVFPWVVDGEYLLRESRDYLPITTLVLLRDANLIGDLQGDITVTIKTDERGRFALTFRSKCVVISATPLTEFHRSVISISRVAREIIRAIPIEDSPSVIESIIRRHKDYEDVRLIQVGSFTKVGEKVHAISLSRLAAS